MGKKPRQKITAHVVDDVSKLDQMTEEELAKLFDQYDPENYNPLDNLDEKEKIVSKNKTDVVTIRLSSQENQIITELADENGLSKSAFIRMAVKKALREHNVR